MLGLDLGTTKLRHETSRVVVWGHEVRAGERDGWTILSGVILRPLNGCIIMYNPQVSYIKVLRALAFKTTASSFVSVRSGLNFRRYFRDNPFA